MKRLVFTRISHHKRNVSSSSETRLSKPVSNKAFFKFDSTKESLVSRLCQEKKYTEAIDVLCSQNRLREAVRLLDHIEKPSALLYSALIHRCLQHRALEEGRTVHAHTKASGFVPGTVISNRVIDMYVKCGSLNEARKVFDEMPDRDLCSWNTLISGYAKSGQADRARKLFDEMGERDNFSWSAMMSGYVRSDRPREALELFRTMRTSGENLKPNMFTVSSALAASGAVRCLRTGKEIHGHMTRTGLDSDLVVWSALLDMYGKCGSVDEARHVFDKMADRDVVSWTAMIDRYFEEKRSDEGFALFSSLVVGSGKTRPNEFTFASVLNACADRAAEELGKQVHGYMTRSGFDPSSFAGSALVHMYMKCGNVERGKRVFEGMPDRDLVSWTSLIVGYAQHGYPNEALRVFESLLKSGTKPDHVAFVGVLSACVHAGLVDKGLEYFRSIKSRHGIEHTPDHYACVVDLLARSGRLKEAEEIIDEMPLKPNKYLWAALLGGSRIHGNLGLAKRAAEALFEIEPENPATYVTLANAYSKSGLWVEAASVRKVMDEKKVVSRPGMSWIEVGREKHVFVAGDKSHPRYGEIDGFLKELRRRMKEDGYFPDIEE